MHHENGGEITHTVNVGFITTLQNMSTRLRMKDKNCFVHAIFLNKDFLLNNVCMNVSQILHIDPSTLFGGMRLYLFY